jgi:hypothetical protein
MISEDYIETIIMNYYNAASGLNLRISSIDEYNFITPSESEILYRCVSEENKYVNYFGVFLDKELVLEYDNFKHRKILEYNLEDCKLNNLLNPVIIKYSSKGIITKQEWFKNNKRHRENNPAVESIYQGNKWYIEGEEYTREEAERFFLQRKVNKF